jgi:hypothetical protein
MHGIHSSYYNKLIFVFIEYKTFLESKNHTRKSNSNNKRFLDKIRNIPFKNISRRLLKYNETD